MRTALLLAIAAAVLPHRGMAFVWDVNAAGQARRWMLNPPDARVPVTAVNRNTRAIIYHLDAEAYSGGEAAAAELDAIRTAFDQWQAVTNAALRFEEGPLVNGTTDIDSQDGRNTFFWAKSLFVNGGRDNLSGVLALTYVASFPDGNVIADADTVFNGVQFRWFTDFEKSTTQEIFVEAIALHEIGHALGLRHSPVGGATMLFQGDRGVNSQVGLSADEFAAARALYPPPTGAATGTIRGAVRLEGTPLLGAAVMAEDASGNLAAGTVTRQDGTYSLPGLLPGGYRVRAVPLDPMGQANYLIRGTDIASAYQSAHTSFLPTADQEVTLAVAGQVVADFHVTGGVPLRLVRVLIPAADLSSPSFTSKPVTVTRGGPEVYLGVLASGALEGDVSLTVTGDGVQVGETEVRPNALGAMALAAARVRVSEDATPGLRSFRLRRGADVAWVNGFLEVRPPIPDLNSDGLDDRFQRRYWTRFTRPEAGPDADPDGDGFTNAWEYQTGTDPTDPLSARFEVVSVTVTEAGARVRSQTAPGKTFQLYSRDTVPGAEWNAVGAPVVATGTETEFVDPTATNSVRFYRVRLM